MLSGKSARDGKSGDGTPIANSQSPLSIKGVVLRPFSYVAVDNKPNDELKGPTSAGVLATPHGKYFIPNSKDKVYTTAKKAASPKATMVINQTPIEFKESSDLDRVNQYNFHEYLITANNSAQTKSRKGSMGTG